MKFHHACIQTNCYAESLDFYTRVLGMTIEQETAGFHGRAYNTWLRAEDFRIELQTPKAGCSFLPMDSEHTAVAHLCFYVDDLEAACQALQQQAVHTFLLHDGQILYQVHGSKLFKLTAPEGTIFEFRDTLGC